MQVGFIGLGRMGAPIAGHLAGPGLIVYDVRREAMEPLVRAGARAARSVAAASARADVVSVMVRGDDQVEEVAAEVLASARPGTVLAIHSAIRPGVAEDLAARALRYDIAVVDAPVGGSVAGAAAGTLAVTVGGTDAAFARCREAFAPWTAVVLHAGPVGAATRAEPAPSTVNARPAQNPEPAPDADAGAGAGQRRPVERRSAVWISRSTSDG